MSRWLSLGDIAHCRFGDKGDTGLFVLIPYDARDFAPLVSYLTPRRIAHHLGGLPESSVICRPCPELGAILLVVGSSLGGGVTTSLAVDAHGKTLSGYLLGMAVLWPAG